MWGDNRGSVFLVDAHNYLIRVVRDGVISRIAGNFQVIGPSGDGGLALDATLGFNPQQVLHFLFVALLFDFDVLFRFRLLATLLAICTSRTRPECARSSRCMRQQGVPHFR